MSFSPFAISLIERAAALGLELSAPHASQLERYYSLLRKWNDRTNLTALVLDAVPAPETIDRLFMEPLVAKRFIEDVELDVIDVGSGGGSPALPLKVFRQRLRLRMIESRSRKAAFLREAVRHLELVDAEVLTERVQQLAIGSRALADIVTIRGVRIDRELSDAVRQLLKPTGRLLTFGPADPPVGFTLAQSAALPTAESFLNIWSL